MNPFEPLKKSFETYFEQAFPALAPQITGLEESVRYSLMAGGKRLRPILLLAVIKAAGKPTGPAMPFAAAVEFIHTYSLIHDDLPCMDDDDLRRGKPTNHKVYGEDIALLAGDSLLSEAFVLLSDPKRTEDYTPATLLKVVHCLSLKAGNQGMVAGQAADIKADQSTGDLELLEYIHHHKTGQLITAALEIGGLLAGLPEDKLGHLVLFGHRLGQCFQIQDDILDLTGDEAQIGKPVGSDQRNKKLTYPSLSGLEASKKLAEQAYHQAVTHLEASGLKTDELKPLADFILKRDH